MSKAFKQKRLPQEALEVYTEILAKLKMVVRESRMVPSAHKHGCCPRR